MPSKATLSAELRELDEMMQRRNEKFLKVLSTLKDCLSSIPHSDARSTRSLETYLHLIDLSFMEVDREQRRYRDWLERAGKNRRGISEETLEKLREYRMKLGADTDEEIIEELIKVVEVRP